MQTITNISTQHQPIMVSVFEYGFNGYNQDMDWAAEGKPKDPYELS